MAVTISSREELEAWLDDRPYEWSLVIALRASLRVVPLAIDPTKWVDEQEAKRLSLAVHRAMVVSWAVARNTENAEELRDSALAACKTVMPFTNPSQSRAWSATRAASVWVDTARLAADTNYASADAAYAGEAAAESAAGLASEEAKESASYGAELWSSISTDCEELIEGKLPANLLIHHLWSNAPNWWFTSVNSAGKWLFDAGSGFNLWRVWFESRVRGIKTTFALFDEEADEAFYRWIVGQDDDWWSREPDEVNAEIAAFIDGLRGVTGQNYVSSLVPDEARRVLENTADPEAVFENGKFTIRASMRFGPARTIAPTSLAETLIDLSEMLAEGLEDNAPRALRAALRTYSRSLKRDPKQPSSDTLDPAAGVVRKLHRNDGHDIWAKGLDESFERFLKGHARLFGKLPEPAKQAEERAKLTLNSEARKAPLYDDVARLKDVAVALKDAGLTDADMDIYFTDLIDLGIEIAFGGPDLDEPDAGIETAPATWTAKDLYRANVAGLGMQIESQIALALSVTAHPNVQAIGPLVYDFANYMLRYFI